MSDPGAGVCSENAHAWPTPLPFDSELREEEKKYWATHSKGTLGGVQSGLNRGEPLPGVIAVKNTSREEVLLVVVCTGKESLFPKAKSVKHIVGTNVHGDLAVKATLPTPSVEIGGGVQFNSSSENVDDLEPRPDEEPRIITAEFVPKGSKGQLISVGSIRNVYLHIFFSHNVPKDGRWGKKMQATPIVPFSYYYQITDNELRFCSDAEFDYTSVSQQLLAPV